MERKKWITTALCALLTATTVFATSCKESQGASSSSSSSSSTEVTQPTKTRGVHVDNSTKSGKYLFQNGSTAYKVLVPAQASETVSVAAEELVTFFEQASGIRLSVVKDDAMVATDKYLSIGNTALLAQSGLKAGAELGDDGFQITTKDEQVFLYGYKDAGALCATYELLAKLFDFDAYYWDTYGLEKNVTSRELMNYDIKEIPDFTVRATGYEVMTANPTWTRRLRVIPMWEIFEDTEVGDKWDAKVHNALYILDQDVYNDPNVPETYHPDWFMYPKRPPKQNQPCFTAHGKADEYELMVDTIVERLSLMFVQTKKPQEETLRFQFDISDNPLYCECDACKAAAEQYGSLAGLNIKICNDISEGLYAWMETDAGKAYKRDFELYFLAYEKMETPPVKTDDAGNEYATITCNDNVIPIVAPAHMDFMDSVYADVNVQYRENMELWKLASEHSFLWSYSTNFNHYWIMYDVFGEIQEYYQFYYDNGFRQIREESQDRQYGGTTGFHNFKVYLHGKIAWNVDADVNQLTKKYFANYFGPAADVMLDLFHQNRAYIESLKNRTNNKYGGDTSMYLAADNPEFWNTSILRSWWKKAESAFALIEPLKKTDLALYNTLYDHIAMERLSYCFMLATIFENDLSEQELKQVRGIVKEDVTRIGITLASEYVPITDIIGNW